MDEEEVGTGKRGHTEEEIPGTSGGRIWINSGRGVPQAWHQSAELLSLEEEVCGSRSERELRQFREENNKLKRLVADLSPDRHILQEIVAKSSQTSHASRAGEVGSISSRFEPAARGGADSRRSCDSRFEHDRDPQDALRVRLRELAGSRVRYGYRRLTVMLSGKDGA
jgi:hypothetical protein